MSGTYVLRAEYSRDVVSNITFVDCPATATRSHHDGTVREPELDEAEFTAMKVLGFSDDELLRLPQAIAIDRQHEAEASR